LSGSYESVGQGCRIHSLPLSRWSRQAFSTNRLQYYKKLVLGGSVPGFFGGPAQRTLVENSILK
ncbi:MAG: hypothetical protein PUA87_06335, partial [Oscillospiraceae bacterium]|nr:hypothetical protein [Oscillospiraceae bacterium]